MKIRRRDFLIGSGSAGLVGLAAPYILPSRAEHMPLLTITSPGTYAVTADYTVSSPSDPAILIAPNTHNVNVILYSRLVCLASLPTNRSNAAILFAGNNNACNVIGMGGSTRGFGYGLAAQNCQSLRVDNLNVSDALIRGMHILGNDAVVRNCMIRNIYGSTYAPTQFCMGIEVQGSSPKVMNNIVEGCYGSGPEPDNGEGVGISISDFGVGAVVMGNFVRNWRKQPKSIGYWMGGSSDVSYIHNHAENMVYGGAASSPTMGAEDENSYRNCTTDFVDSGGDWIIGGRDG